MEAQTYCGGANGRIEGVQTTVLKRTVRDPTSENGRVVYIPVHHVAQALWALGRLQPAASPAVAAAGGAGAGAAAGAAGAGSGAAAAAAAAAVEAAAEAGEAGEAAEAAGVAERGSAGVLGSLGLEVRAREGVARRETIRYHLNGSEVLLFESGYELLMKDENLTIPSSRQRRCAPAQTFCGFKLQIS